MNATLGLGRRLFAMACITCGFFITGVLLIVMLDSLSETVEMAGIFPGREASSNSELPGMPNPAQQRGDRQRADFEAEHTNVRARDLDGGEGSSQQAVMSGPEGGLLRNKGAVEWQLAEEPSQLISRPGGKLFELMRARTLVETSEKLNGDPDNREFGDPQAVQAPPFADASVAGSERRKNQALFPEVPTRLPPLYEQVVTASASGPGQTNSSDLKLWSPPEFPLDFDDSSEDEDSVEPVESSDSKTPVIFQSGVNATPVENRLGPPLRTAQIQSQSSLPPLPSPEPDANGTAAPQENQATEQPDSGADQDEDTLGEEPEPPDPQFLRNQTILLDPGEYQIEWGIQYLQDSSDFTLAQVVGDSLVVAEAKRRARVLMTPVEFRYGISPVLQANVNIPWGFSSNEFSFFSTDDFGNAGGLGDVTVGLTGLLVEGKNKSPDVLIIAAVTAPTGEADFASTLAVPGSSLGEGFWAFTGGVNFIRTYDPVVLFWGAGYRHRLQANFDDEVVGTLEVEPGAHAFYRLGVGFAINPQVTVGASFTGSYIAENVINGSRTAGGIREPMMLRLNVTIADSQEQGKNNKLHQRPHSQWKAKTTEPFVNIGLTETAADVMFGVSWTK